MSAKDYLGDGDRGYTHSDGELGYSLNYFNTTEEDTTLNFESKFIQEDRATSVELAEFLLMWYCNQHTIINLTFSDFKYGFLEVGDVISFNSLIEGKLIYGEDYTTTIRRNGQQIYPFFLVTSVEKSLNSIKIECMQLHRLNRDFTAELGDIDRDGVVELAGNDLDLLTSYVNDNIPRNSFTLEQIRNMDINGSESVNERDITFWPEWWELNHES